MAERVAMKRVPLAALKPAPWNPRQIKDARFKNLCASITADPEFMERRPILALLDGTIYAGNMRYRAVSHLGWTDVPAIVEDLDERLARERALRDNAQWGEWEPADLAAFVYDLKTQGSDLTLLGFESVEIDKLLAAANGDAQEDEVPEPPKVPITQPGDLWLLGEHRLLCGDSTNLTDVERLMDGQKARLVVTSPPYNQNLDTFKPSGMQKEHPSFVKRMAASYADSLPEDEYRAQQIDMLNGLWAVTTDDASVFYNHKHRYREMRVVSPLEWVWQTGWALRQEIIWDRTSSMTLNARMFMPSDERVYWLFKGDSFYFADTADVKAWSTVWRIAAQNEVSVSAPFANEVPARIIRACSEMGDLVYDPYGGSGTTLIMAERAGRLAVSMEITPAYCDVIVQRWEALTGRNAEREPARAAAAA